MGPQVMTSLIVRFFKGLVQNRYELGTFGLPARLRRNSNSRNEFTVNVISCSTDSTDEEYPAISYHSNSTSGESTDSLSKRYTETNSTDIECPVVTRNTDSADEESTDFSTEESLQSSSKERIVITCSTDSTDEESPVIACSNDLARENFSVITCSTDSVDGRCPTIIYSSDSTRERNPMIVSNTNPTGKRPSTNSYSTDSSSGGLQILEVGELSQKVIEIDESREVIEISAGEPSARPQRRAAPAPVRSRHRVYSFYEGKVNKIFELWCEQGFKVPNKRYLDYTGWVPGEPYYDYHGVTDHDIRDCKTFKGLVQNKYELGVLELPSRFVKISSIVEEFPPKECEGVAMYKLANGGVHWNDERGNFGEFTPTCNMVSCSPCKEEDIKHQPRSLSDLRNQVSKCQNSIKCLIKQQEKTMDLLQDMYAYLNKSRRSVEMRPKNSLVIREAEDSSVTCLTIFCTCTQEECSCERDVERRLKFEKR
jgi:hypothetical protein